MRSVPQSPERREEPYSWAAVPVAIAMASGLLCR